MKIKYIKSLLSRKIKHWISNIDDPKIQELVAENVIVSGGAITNMLLNERVNDFDIYFKTPESAQKIAQYYVNKFIEKSDKKFSNYDIHVLNENGHVSVKVRSKSIAGEEENSEYTDFEDMFKSKISDTYLEDLSNDFDITAPEKKKNKKKKKKNKNNSLYRPVFISSNAITLSDKIQLVTRFTGTIDEIHENYDFTHCKCAFDFDSKKIHIPVESLECILNKELRYTTSRYPLCSLFRIRKFLDRGWTINAGQILKIAWDLNKLDLTNYNTLKDQLIGVDSAYFHDVLYKLRKNSNEKNIDPNIVDETYLMKVVNLVF